MKLPYCTYRESKEYWNSKCHGVHLKAMYYRNKKRTFVRIDRDILYCPNCKNLFLYKESPYHLEMLQSFGSFTKNMEVPA